jgi:hypothetical protein
MAQTKDGAVKLSANNYGLSVVDYLDKIKTENYCNKCKKWKPKNIFCIDRSRATGLHKNCNDCRRINNGIRGRPFVKGQQSIFKGKHHSDVAKNIMRKNNAGNRNPNWKGGTTGLITQIRNTTEFKEWRKNVYYKGKFTCSKCRTKKIGRNIILDADHIYPLSRMISDYKVKTVADARLVPEIWDLNNGRCLCRDCHKQTKTWGVNANKKIRNGKN